jgi:threonylcarbamoyladenosine tRNA methylthiotransferase MtaB
MARGRSRNPAISEVVQDATLALREGAKEIVLTGVNIGDFGRSTGEKFYDLVQALDLLPFEHYRLRISSCEPNLLSDEIIDFVAHSKHFAPHLHIPLQSGSDEVLRIMHRHYDTALFQERVEHIRRVMPDAFIGVDCMVGVRGETQERWDEYVRFVETLDVSQLHVFTYSERANTRMLEMTELYVVPQQERERRSKVLHGISDKKLQSFYHRCQGQERLVLWESRNDKGNMYGFTDNYIKLSRPFNPEKVNSFEKVIVS